MCAQNLLPNLGKQNYIHLIKGTSATLSHDLTEVITSLAYCL